MSETERAIELELASYKRICDANAREMAGFQRHREMVGDRIFRLQQALRSCIEQIRFLNRRLRRASRGDVPPSFERKISEFERLL